MFNKLWTIAMVLLVATAGNVMGHPGPLDEHGCHTCEGEECAKWGLYDGQFHCHKKNLYGETEVDFEMWQAMLCHAIYNKYLVKVVMKLGGAADQQPNRAAAEGDPGTREMVLMPFAFGFDEQNQPVFRAYRLTGFPEERKWETYRMANILELIIVNVNFENYKEGADAGGISDVECQFGVEPKEEEGQDQ